VDKISKFKKWISKPFPKKLPFLSLAKYWFIFFIVGVGLRLLILFFYPPSGQAEEKLLTNFCTPFTLMFVVLAPITENLLFMILPFMWKRNKGLIAGLTIWVFLHYLERDLPSLLQNIAIAIFYFKIVSAKKYKETIFFHGIINWPAGLLCLF